MTPINKNIGFSSKVYKNKKKKANKVETNMKNWMVLLTIGSQNNTL